MRYLTGVVLGVLFGIGATLALAGSLDSPAAPASSGSAMFTLEDIYNRLDNGTTGSKRPGAFVEPTLGPTINTGHTLDEVMAKTPSVDDTNGTGVAEVLAGKTFWGLTSGAWGLRTGTMINNGAGKTIIPGTANQTMAAEYWSSANTVSGDADLVSGNIRSGVSIFAVSGNSNVVDTNSGDAVAGDILSGKKAWVDGSEVTGSLDCPPVSTGDAVFGDVLDGKTFSNASGTGHTGTMVNQGAKDYTPSAGNQTISAGYYNGSGHVTGDADLVSGNIRSGVSIFAVSGNSNVVDTNSGDAVAGDILSGKKAWVDGSEVTGSLACPPASTGDAVIGDVLDSKTFSNASGTGHTGTMVNQGAKDYAPSAGDQTISAGYYNGSGHVAGDADLLPGNIKASTEIFGVTGTFPNDGTAATGEVKSGSTFYTNSAAKLTGTGTKTLSSANDTVSAGYYEATTLSAVDADLTEANIKKDVNIFGTVGTYTGCTCSGTMTGTRWCDNGDGTVTDMTTCLVWLKDASAGGSYALWVDTAEGTSAHDRAAQFKDGVGGLTDGSVEGDWRLPTKTELYNLANGDEAVRSSDMRAFTDVQFSYRSSSTCEVFIARSWIVYMETGVAGSYAKVATHLNYVWPVRGR